VDAVPVEPLRLGSLKLDTRFFSVTADEHEYVTVELPLGAGSNWAWIERTIAAVSYVTPHHGRANRLIHATDNMATVHGALLALDDADCSIANLNRLIGFGACTEPDIGWPDDLKPVLDTLPATEPAGSARAVVGSTVSTEDAEVTALWRALRTYGGASYTASACAYCQASLLEITPDAVVAAHASDADPGSIIAALVASAHGVIDIRVTTCDPVLVKDHREGLRRLIGGILAALRLVLVMVLAALSHQAQAPTFLLVMLATTRHYGRHGDGDSHLLCAPALQIQRRKGAVCLAA
jgi:hypothetical protein